MGWEDDSKPSANDNTSVSASITRRGASYSGNSVDTEPAGWSYDLSTDKGRKDWFTLNVPDNITKGRMDGHHFTCRWDGKFHPSLPVVSPNSYCQYCRYKFKHILDDAERAQNKGMNENKSRIERCITCKVNLCWSCRLEWHDHGVNKLGRMLAK